MSERSDRKVVYLQTSPKLAPILRTTLSLVEHYSSPYEINSSVPALRRALMRTIQELDDLYSTQDTTKWEHEIV